MTPAVGRFATSGSDHHGSSAMTDDLVGFIPAAGTTDLHAEALARLEDRVLPEVMTYTHGNQVQAGRYRRGRTWPGRSNLLDRDPGGRLDPQLLEFAHNPAVAQRFPSPSAGSVHG